MQTRLTFIALWSYVDDNGVGKDTPKLIAAELYPLEDDPRETLAHVSVSLDELAAHFRIARYVVKGKRWLYVNNWTEHQKIDHPNKARYPMPDEADEPLTCTDTDPRETLAQPARDVSAIRSPGAVEQGNRGAGDQGAGEASRDKIARTAGTRLPEPFPITDEMREWVATEGITVSQARASTERFVDYWRGKPGKDGRKTDWVATWRNWLRRDVENGPSGLKPDRNRQILDAAMERARAAEAAMTPERKALG